MTDPILSDSRIAFDKVNGQVPVSALMYDALARVDSERPVELNEATVARFNQRITDTARLLGNSPLLSRSIDRADAFHYLLTTIHSAIDHSVLQTDTTEPMFSPIMPTHRVDWGARNPDGIYRRAYISPDRSYRVHGRLGNAKYFTFDFVGASYDRNVGYGVDVDELQTDSEGNFEFFLGGPERPDRWYPTKPFIQAIATREFFDDWAGAKRAVLRIDCTDVDVLDRTEPEVRPEHHPARVAAEFDIIGDWIYEAGARFWLNEWHSEGNAAATRNRFNDFYRKETKRPTVSRGCWDLDEHEALILEFPDPKARYWGIQMSSIMIHTLDFANRLTTINNGQTKVDGDGQVRIVVSHRDPGVHNWLDTMSLSHGDLMMRIHRPETLQTPTTQVVTLSELTGEASFGGPVSVKQRREQIAERREGAARLFCD